MRVQPGQSVTAQLEALGSVFVQARHEMETGKTPMAVADWLQGELGHL